MAKNSGGNGNSCDGLSARLKHTVSGCVYVDKDIQGLAGATLDIEGVEVRRMDQERYPNLAVRGKSGTLHSVPMAYFTNHPPIDELRKIAVVV